MKTIIAQRGRPLTQKRNEYGKAIRKAYESGGIHEKRANMQQYEPRNDGICNTITTVLKDNLILRKVVLNMATIIVKEPKDGEKGAINIIRECEPDVEDAVRTDDGKTIEDYLYTAKDGNSYGIFKLSPRECGRLMGCNDADISKMLSVNSNSQCYKQFGNSIVVPVLMAIFSQLHIKGVAPWNELTPGERNALVERTTIDWERGN